MALSFLYSPTLTSIHAAAKSLQSCLTPCDPHRRQPTRLCCLWNSPGKNTGVGCHCLLQSVKVKSEIEIAQSCSTFHDPMDCSPPGSSIHGIFQARVLEWVPLPSLHPYMTTGKTIALTRWTFIGKVMSLLFNTLPGLVIAFLPRSKRLLISWLQSPSTVILEPQNIKSVTVSIASPSIFHEVMGPNCQHLLDHKQGKRVPEKHLFLLYWLCQSLWLCGLQ